MFATTNSTAASSQSPLPIADIAAVADHADAEEDRQQALLRARKVGIRAEHRRDDRDDGQRERGRHGEALGRHRWRQVVGGDRREVDREHGRDDGALESGVRPVVDRPRALLFGAEPKLDQPAGEHQNVLRAIHSRISESTTTYRSESRVTTSCFCSAPSPACTDEAPPRR